MQHAFEDIPESTQLLVAADECAGACSGRLVAHAADPKETHRGDQLGLAPGIDRDDRLGGRSVRDEAPRGEADEDLPRTRCLLQAGGGVDRIARDQRLPSGGLPGSDLAGVDARAGGDPDAALTLELDVEGRQGVAHLGGRTDRPEGIVLVEDREPEDRHDRVADVLLDGPAVALDDRRHGLEVSGHHPAERLRVKQARRAPSSRRRR